jgi:hypothetical protein
MALRKRLRSADCKLVADDTIACFLELRAYRLATDPPLGKIEPIRPGVQGETGHRLRQMST